MAGISKIKGVSAQNYPRIQDEADRYCGYLDDSRLQPHTYRISEKELIKIIRDAIENANRKSSRSILNIPETKTVPEIKEIYKKEGVKLFNYFKKYYGDPASTAYASIGKHYTLIGQEQFRNRTLQKERMNSGWRYQYIAKDGADRSKRFLSVSDIGTKEADFNATIKVLNFESNTLTIYVSVKNRANTVGGQDMPKSIRALEDVAKNDKNRVSPYICVFGIAMDKGQRYIRFAKEIQTPYSMNTEIWLSDYFWPFFTNYTYEEIVKAVLNVLMQSGEKDNIETVVPKELLDSFGECCRKHGLLDRDGCFYDAIKLVDLFVGNNAKKETDKGKE